MFGNARIVTTRPAYLIPVHMFGLGSFSLLGRVLLTRVRLTTFVVTVYYQVTMARKGVDVGQLEITSVHFTRPPLQTGPRNTHFPMPMRRLQLCKPIEFCSNRPID
jgi:hypothetical protein